MSVLLLVQAEVQYGHLHDFVEGSVPWIQYRRDHAWTVPKIWVGMSGPMNHVVMQFEYPSADHYLQEEQASASDPDYGQIAGRLFLREPSIRHDLYREAVGVAPSV